MSAYPATAILSFITEADECDKMNSGSSLENSYPFKPDDFAPPRELRLCPSAIEEARQFLTELHGNDRNSKWIIAFTWCYRRSFRHTETSQNIDEGPGIDLAAYRSSDIPPEFIDVRNGVPVTFIVPKNELAMATRKEIVETRLASGRLSYTLV